MEDQVVIGRIAMPRELLRENWEPDGLDISAERLYESKEMFEGNVFELAEVLAIKTAKVLEDTVYYHEGLVTRYKVWGRWPLCGGGVFGLKCALERTILFVVIDRRRGITEFNFAILGAAVFLVRRSRRRFFGIIIAVAEDSLFFVRHAGRDLIWARQKILLKNGIGLC